MHIIAPHMSCVVNLPLSADQPNELDQAMAEGYAEIYVITAAGVIKHHKLRGNNRYIRVKVDKVPGFDAPKLDQAINFLPAGKIPKALFDQILAFFYGVMAKNGEKALEAMSWICYNREEGYHIIIPEQQISAAAVHYNWNDVPAGTSIVCDIHSHNLMNAFFSATDNADDRANISFSGVVGKMNQATPDTVWRFNYLDRKFEAKFEDIFDVQAAQFPTEWLGKVDTSAPRTTYPAGNLGARWSNQQPSSQPATGKGRADHLKPYQFKKKHEVEDEMVNGNRVGPHLRSGRSGGLGDHVYSDDFWGLGSAYDDRSFADVTEDPLVGSTGGRRLGKPVGGVRSVVGDNAFSSSASPDAISPSSMMHERWNELAVNHGEDVANAFCLIDDVNHELAGEDGLLEDLIGDMFELGSDHGQLRIIRALYDRLSPRDQEALATTGF